MNANEGNIRKRSKIQHWHVVTLLLVCYDAVAVATAYFGALLLRFDLRISEIPHVYIDVYIKGIPICILICILTFAVFKLYRSIWRFASFSELIRMILATSVTFVLNTLLLIILVGRMPVPYYIFGIVLQFILTLSIRFLYRLVLLIRGKNTQAQGNSTEAKVMVIGAGRAGQQIVREIKTANDINERVCCIIDDNDNKHGRYIEGVPVVGGRGLILEASSKYDINKIYLAIPSAGAKVRRDILDICKMTGAELKNLPGMSQLATNKVSIKEMRDVEIEDLLGREPIKVNSDEVAEYVRGKVVLVTGGGGSIGSELCRQIAAHNPKTLIIFDIYENNAYDIQLELKDKYPDMDLVTLIGSVRDNLRMLQMFEKYSPNIVFHAAAHKHVPLMEDSYNEAIKNNTLGTYNTAFAAMISQCEKFVLISTDKAVNPTNCMGATKRSCEMIIQALNHIVKSGQIEKAPRLIRSELVREWINQPERLQKLRTTKTEFVAVRFGNVLGSNGSVIPLFKKQMLAGGPITVTHPDIIRYFMTIPEAVGLVLQAATYAKGGEIFVLDMGEPVKIADLARNLIRLSGYVPDKDIKIEFIGLRPGEKLYEEKLMAEEGMKKTANELIHIGSPIPFDIEEFLKKLETLMNVAYKDSPNSRELLAEIVPNYIIDSKQL